MASWNGSSYVYQDWTTVGSVGAANTMVNYSPQSAVVGIASTSLVGIGTTTSVTGYQPTDSPDTRAPGDTEWSMGELGISTNTRRGWAFGRRPHQGQKYPRGVYNK